MKTPRLTEVFSLKEGTSLGASTVLMVKDLAGKDQKLDAAVQKVMSAVQAKGGFGHSRYDVPLTPEEKQLLASGIKSTEWYQGDDEQERMDIKAEIQKALKELS